MSRDSHPAFEVSDVRTFPLQAPIATPRRNSFGVQTARPGLFVQVELPGGQCGWGEAFSNWPSFAPLHRARIVDEVLSPLVARESFASPADLARTLTQATAKLAIQCAEPGPFASCIAALEIAASDAVARRQKTRLVDWLGGQHSSPVPYASGLAPEAVAAHVPKLIETGWTAFKVKIGFGVERDVTTVKHLRDLVGPTACIMVDANMAYSVSDALQIADRLARFDLDWMEEPIPADAPPEDWLHLTQRVETPVAAGENLRGITAFIALAEAGVRVLQPDICKWGGLSSALQVSRICADRDLVFAPHFLGGAVGYAATKAVAEAGSAALLETDITENLLRELPADGADQHPFGIGITPRTDTLRRFAFR